VLGCDVVTQLDIGLVFFHFFSNFNSKNRAEAVRQDYLARMHAFMASCRRSFDFNRVLEGRWVLLSI
jgi:hypothetical protein